MILRRRVYTEMTTTSLRALRRVLSKSAMRRLFAGQIAGIDLELTTRDLPGIADECGAHLVQWILGVQ